MKSVATKCMVVIGHPVSHSLSPAIHNAGYKALGIDGEFVYTARDVRPEQIRDFVNDVRSTGIRGVSCTMPHKEIIMPLLDEIDPIASKIGAVNTVVNENGCLHGYNTDWIGAVEPLKAVTELKGKNVALIGAGGAARAFAYGLTREGAVVTIYNRTQKKAEDLAKDFNCKAEPLQNPESIKLADIICNATLIGMKPEEDQMPLPAPAELLLPTHVVFDSVYSPYETKLLKAAKNAGATIIHGTEMLLWQAMAQFKLYTGYGAPEQAMREALAKAVNS